MSRSITELRVFIAAPGDLEEERKAFKEELLAYTEMDASRRGILFAPVGWELTLGGVGRPQSLINADLVLCDYFILVLHDRWGSSTDAGERSRYSAGIEEEYEVALKCFADPERPMNEISIFFKAVNERRPIYQFG